MKKLLTLVIPCLLSFSAVFAQKDRSDANIVGDVQSKGEHLAFIAIGIKGTTLGTQTDKTGHFQLINLPEGTHEVVARGLGFKTKTEVVTIKNGETREIKFVLEEDLLNLEEVVVSADRNEMNRREAPVVINAITPELFKLTSAATIADGLDFTPGVRMECNCQNCGFSQVRMNGLEGPYSQILINSRPVFSGLAGVYGLELIPANMVERIEVTRGGGSALFGGNAIAGTVNIITKEPLSNSFETGHSLSLVGVGDQEGGEIAADQVFTVNGSLVTDDSRSGLNMYGMIRDRDPYDENGDGYSESVLMKNTTFGISTFHKPTTQSKVSLDLYRINEFRRGGNKFDYLPHETDITEQLNHVITGGSLSYDLFTDKKKFNKLSFYTSMQQTDRDSYYGAGMDPSAYGHTDDLAGSTGGLYTANFDKLLFAESQFLIGVDNNFNTLTDVKLGTGGQPNKIITDQFVNTVGAFVQNTWDMGFMKLTTGLRLDNYLVFNHDVEHDDLSGSVLAPRLNTLFNMTEDVQLRLSYAKGYRAPQIYDEDLHIESSQARTIVHGNSLNLKQETSHSFTSSVNLTKYFSRAYLEFLAEGFMTRLQDPFANEFSQLDSNGTYQYLRINAQEGAMVGGTNLELNVAMKNEMKLQIGYTIQASRFDKVQKWGEQTESVSREFVRTPAQYGFLTFSCHLFKELDFSVTGTYTGPMYIPHFGLDPNTTDPAEMQAIANGDVITGERLERSEHFFHAGFRVARTLKLSKETSLELSFGLQNVLNQLQAEHDSGPYRDAGYIYGPCKPRTFVFGVKMGNLM